MSGNTNYDIVIQDFEDEITMVVLAPYCFQVEQLERRWQTTFAPPADGGGWSTPTFEQID